MEKIIADLVELKFGYDAQSKSLRFSIGYLWLALFVAQMAFIAFIVFS